MYVCMFESMQVCMSAFLFIYAIIWGVYIDYSGSAVGHNFTMWQPYLLKDICQYCEMYVY